MAENNKLIQAIDEARKYETIKEFRENSSASYHLIAKAKVQSDAFSHMRRIRVTQDRYEDGRHCTQCLERQPIENFLFASKNSSRRRSICKSCHNLNCRKWRENNPDKSRAIGRRSAKLKGKEYERERAKAKRKKYPHAAAARDMLKRCLRLTGQRKSRTTEHMMGYKSTSLKAHIESQFLPGMSWSNWGEWHIDHITPVAVMVRAGITDPAVINALSNLRPLWAKENLSKVWEARADRKS